METIEDFLMRQEEKMCDFGNTIEISDNGWLIYESVKEMVIKEVGIKTLIKDLSMKDKKRVYFLQNTVNNIFNMYL